jgi:single-strand DNA-binding protein
MGYQRFVCLGNVTNDPEIRPVGESEVAKFSVAVNGFKDSVEYFDLEWWNPNGAMAYVQKGSPILVEGELQTQSWERDGVKRKKTVVKVRTLQLTGKKEPQKRAMEEEFATDFA